MRKIILLIYFIISFTFSFSSVKNKILGKFQENKNILKISILNNEENLFKIDYSFYEKPLLYVDGKNEEKYGKIIFIGRLLEVYEPNKSNRKSKKVVSPDFRYTFVIDKIISSNGHPNVYTKAKDKVYISYYESSDKISLSAGFYNPDLRRVVK